MERDDEVDPAAGAALAGQVAVVTGGAAGIGAATCRALAAAGATVVAVDRDGAAATALARSLAGDSRHEAHALDVTETVALHDLIIGVGNRLGRLDLLVDNAGIADVVPLGQVSPEHWRRTFAVNVEAPLAAMQAAASVMREQAPSPATGCRGKIVNISSAAARHGRPLMPAYGASKAALDHLSQSAAAAWGELGIATTILYPGNVAGAMWPGLAERLAPFEGRSAEAILAARASSSPSGRLQRPDEVAGLVLYIAGHEGMGLNGAVVWSEPHAELR